MRRFRELTTETAGFYNTVGFNDDTRAYLSIPARHDVARRVDCALPRRARRDAPARRGRSARGRARPRLSARQGGLQAVSDGQGGDATPRLGNARCGAAVGVARPAYDRERGHAGHRASRHRRVPPRPPGRLHRRLLGRRARLGHRRREPARAAPRAMRSKPQDGLYTLAVRSGEGERAARHRLRPRRPRRAGASASALLAAMADPRIRIVSLTVTEKGYCHDPATGELNEAHPDIRPRPRRARTRRAPRPG